MDLVCSGEEMHACEDDRPEEKIDQAREPDDLEHFVRVVTVAVAVQ